MTRKQQRDRAKIRRLVARFQALNKPKTRRLRRKLPKDKAGWLLEYETQQWVDRRTEILSRDRYMCVLCNSTHNLQVHHKAYDSQLHVWEYTDDYLITVCHPCHERIHLLTPIKSFYTKGLPKYVPKPKD